MMFSSTNSESKDKQRHSSSLYSLFLPASLLSASPPASLFTSSLTRIQLAKDIVSSIITRLLALSLATTSIAMGAIKWKPTSPEDLEKVEAKLLSCKLFLHY